MTTAMRPDRFARRLETDGPDLATWPATERAAAEALLATSPEARRRLDAAMRLARAVEAALPRPDPAATARLRAAVAARIAREPLPAPPRRGFSPVFQASIGALAAAVTCAAWLVFAPPVSGSDPLAPLLQAAALVGDPL